MSGNSRGTSGQHHRFGGEWTERKLKVIAGYLQSYTTALKNKPDPEDPFKLAFIDAFAGTGYREMSRGSGESDSQQSPLFPDFEGPEPQRLLEGSARIALQTEPRFDRYIFVERNTAHREQLERLREAFPDLAERIKIHGDDANQFIQELCEGNWRSHRAVLFLDPYGLQVEWQTIEAIASTQAIDLWLLFPLGIGVNRLLTRSGDIPEPWKERLDRLLGTTDWYDAFYRVEATPDLFGEDHTRVVKRKVEVIGEYFNGRLREIFSGVAKPGVLRNSKNNPLYLLCFAVGNPRGKHIALRIANHLLKEMH